MTTLAYLFIAALAALLFYRHFPGLDWFPVIILGLLVVLWEALRP